MLKYSCADGKVAASIDGLSTAQDTYNLCLLDMTKVVIVARPCKV